MKYMGSKANVAKYIVPILQNIIKENNITTYIEPFCGGCNIIDKITAKNKIANDKQFYLIELLKNREKVVELPDIINREFYEKVKNDYKNNTKHFEAWFIGAIGFFGSYNGKFFDGGYAKITTTKTGITRNYYAEAKRNFEKQVPLLKGIEFYCEDYKTICENVKNALIYCDPPYKNTTQYGISRNFNHSEFWEWCLKMSKNNIVIVSELQAPESFNILWQKEIKRTLNNNSRTTANEKLFKAG